MDQLISEIYKSLVNLKSQANGTFDQMNHIVENCLQKTQNELDKDQIPINEVVSSYEIFKDKMKSNTATQLEKYQHLEQENTELRVMNEQLLMQITRDQVQSQLKTAHDSRNSLGEEIKEIQTLKSQLKEAQEQLEDGMKKIEDYKNTMMELESQISQISLKNVILL